MVLPRSWLIEVAMAVDGMCLASVEVRFSVGPIGVCVLGAVDSMTIASSSKLSQPAVHAGSSPLIESSMTATVAPDWDAAALFRPVDQSRSGWSARYTNPT